MIAFWWLAIDWLLVKGISKLDDQVRISRARWGVGRLAWQLHSTLCLISLIVLTSYTSRVLYILLVRVWFRKKQKQSTSPKSDSDTFTKWILVLSTGQVLSQGPWIRFSCLPLAPGFYFLLSFLVPNEVLTFRLGPWKSVSGHWMKFLPYVLALDKVFPFTCSRVRFLPCHLTPSWCPHLPCWSLDKVLTFYSGPWLNSSASLLSQGWSSHLAFQPLDKVLTFPCDL